MSTTYEGGCGCGQIRYRLEGPPMVVNCCHCTYCQRESGSAFCVNAFYETDRMHVTTDQAIEVTAIPAESGKPQLTHRCPTCKVALWSLYGDRGDYFRAVKVGTLDDSAQMPPDCHIFTSTKLPWVTLSDRPAFEGPPKKAEFWSQESLDRFENALERMKLAQAAEKLKL